MYAAAMSSSIQMFKGEVMLHPLDRAMHRPHGARDGGLAGQIDRDNAAWDMHVSLRVGIVDIRAHAQASYPAPDSSRHE